jgi:hypothetical protein
MTQPAQHSSAFISSFSRLFAALSFATFLALAPAPVFAQHGGGGGGGGGSHGGGGGGGGFHGGSGGGGHASTGGSHTGGGSHPTSTSNGGNPTNPNGGGHWWNPFHSSSGAESKGGANSGAKGTGDGTARFAAGNNVWQDPPSLAHGNTASRNYYATANRGAASSTARPVRNTFANNPRGADFSQNRFHHNPYGYYPYGYGYGYGYGGFGFGLGCDPWWGCPGYGLGFGYGFGYGAGFGYGGGDLGYYSGAPDYGGSDLNFNATTPSSSSEDMGSPEGNAGDWQDAPADNSLQNNPGPQPFVVLILRDGSSYAVSDYWLAGGKLHYVTSYGGENSIDANQLDLQRTVNENALRGVTFTLRPAPGANAPADQHPPLMPPANTRPAPAPNPQ